MLPFGNETKRFQLPGHLGRQLSREPLGSTASSPVADSFESAFVGSALIKAEILEGQVNLYFRQSHIAVYNPITIRWGGLQARSDTPDFPSMLDSVIGHFLRSVETEPGRYIALVLDSGAQLEISTNPDDYSGPEAFSARGPNGELFVEQ